ncbi:Uncharacterised protein [Serratia entomophila]|nr:Uncharacterised protein [Serratia entomophila]CAI1839154.1 Uncharacterised protein [Serratia entomophila]CAI2503496.1 Uncharacterised protein [Serratia entomophila]
MITTVYFDKPPSQDAWIDLTLAVTEVYWLLPATTRPVDINQASDLFSGAVLDVAGLQFSLQPGHMQPVQETLWIDSRQDFFGRLMLLLVHNLCPGCFRIERDTHTAGCGWEQPLIWLRHHLQRPELKAPDAVNERVLTDDSVRRHLVQFRDSINNDELSYHWSVITLMDNVWLNPGLSRSK